MIQSNSERRDKIISFIKLNKIKSIQLKHENFQQKAITLQNQTNFIERSNTSMIMEDSENEYKMRLYEFKISKNRHNELIEKGKIDNQQLLSKKFKEVQLINMYEQLEQNFNNINNKKIPAFKSSIINKEDVNMLTDWLVKSKDVSLLLKYEAKGIEINAEDFHSECDELFNTLIVLKVKEKNQIIGGFTTNNWKGQQRFKYDKHAFLFNLSTYKVYPVDGSMNAIFCDNRSLPIFGQDDLLISGHKGKSIFPYYYGVGNPKYELTQGIRNFFYY